MPLESATYIDGLNASNPAASDAINTADDHLRLIKSTIKATFPNITGPVTATQAAINEAAPLNSPTFTGTPAAPTASPGTNTTQIATTAFVTAALQAVYPIGSIYVNAAVDTNPSTLLGFGTWVAFGSGRVMVGQDTADTSFDVLEETGGSKNAIAVSHTHAYSGTTSSNGAHNHEHQAAYHTSIKYGSNGGFGNYGGGTPDDGASLLLTSTNGAHTHTFSGTTDSAGSSGTNANLQPYIVVKMWKRTA